MEDLPQNPSDAEVGRRSGSGGNTVNVHIDTANIQTNDIDALRRLAEADPELARMVVVRRDWAAAREERSVIIGMVTAGTVAVVLLLVVGYSLVKLGWWQTIAFTAVLLACSHLLRVLLKGEWSDTSWFGQFISVKKPPKD